MRCPFCNSKQVVIHTTGPPPTYHCCECDKLFDDHPDEGSDYSNDPTRRIEAEEERELRQQNKLKRKHPARWFFR